MSRYQEQKDAETWDNVKITRQWFGKIAIVACKNLKFENSHKFNIHVNPPGSSGSLPEMQPDSRTPGSETEPPGFKNTKKKKKKFFFFF